MSKFKEGRTHFRNSEMKGLRQWPAHLIINILLFQTGHYKRSPSVPSLHNWRFTSCQTENGFDQYHHHLHHLQCRLDPVSHHHLCCLQSHSRDSEVFHSHSWQVFAKWPSKHMYKYKSRNNHCNHLNDKTVKGGSSVKGLCPILKRRLLCNENNCHWRSKSFPYRL